MRCGICGEVIGRYYSQLEEHFWKKHRDVIMRFLYAMSEDGAEN